MNSKFFCAIGALLITNSVFAAPVLLEKTTTPGFTAPEYAVAKSCKIDANGQMSISQTIDPLTSKQRIKLEINTAKINDAITQAASGVLTEGPSTVDTGTVRYNAYQKQADGSVAKVVLWEVGGIGPRTNSASAAVLLRNFIDLNCGDPLLN